jgi:hypothetical protein
VSYQNEWDQQSRIDFAQFYGECRNGEARVPVTELAKPVPMLVSLHKVEKREVEWLWPGRIPRGAVTVIDGNPGLGKSFIALDIAARLTTGRPMPNEAGEHGREPGNILILNGEDDLSRTMRPRLDICGADTLRVTSLEGIVDSSGERPPLLPRDMELIEYTITKQEIEMVVVDPVFGFLDGELDSHKDADMRRLMFMLRRVAERTQVAIVLIRHFNKVSNVSDPMYRGGGSIGIIAAARSGLMVAADPKDDSRNILARVKCNLCAPPPNLAYRLMAEGDMARIEWLGVADVETKDLLANRKQSSESDATKNKKAGTKFLAALDELDPDRQGVTKTKIKNRARLQPADLDNAIIDLLHGGFIETVAVEYKCGKNSVQTTEGFRRPLAGIGSMFGQSSGQ